jgi:thiamine-phosphate pyrophosphorylase
LSRAPRLYIVTDRSAAGDRTLPQVIARALEGAPAGQVAVQLREKDLAPRPLLELARALRAVTRAAGAALYLNDRVDVALAAEADGVHLGGGSLAVEAVREIAPALRIGVSTHACAEVAAAARAGADFVVFGPVFDTPSKRGLLAPTGLEALAAACRQPIPVLAIGGVDPESAAACATAGAAGAACIRSVMCATDPSAVTSLFLSRFS